MYLHNIYVTCLQQKHSINTISFYPLFKSCVFSIYPIIFYSQRVHTLPSSLCTTTKVNNRIKRIYIGKEQPSVESGCVDRVNIVRINYTTLNF